MNRYRRAEAGRHRAIETRTWELLRGVDADPTRLFLYLWIGPQSTPYGILRFPEGYALTDLGWTPDRLAQAWGELESRELVWRDDEVVVIVPFLMSNPPANENVLKSWRKAVASLPDSSVFKKLYERASAWLSEDGLAWLSAKAKTSPETVSERLHNRSETVSKLRVQGSESREQYSESRVQGSGSPEGLGDSGGALRSASPREAASLRAPSLEADPAGEPKAAWEGKNREQPETAMKDPTPKNARYSNLLTWLRTGTGDMAYRIRYAKKAGHSDPEIEAALAEVSAGASSPVAADARESVDGCLCSHPREIVAGSPAGGPPSEARQATLGDAPTDPDRRCEATTRAGLACVGRPVVGSLFCKRHQNRREAACALVG